jgi:flagellar hook-length control protein FliK
MSGTRLLSTQGDGAVRANGAAPAPGGPPAGSSTGASSGSPFDAILMLEEVAAAASDVGIDAGAAELGDGLESGNDDPADDEDNQELDDSLAFLAGMFAVAPRHPAHAVAGAAGELAGGAAGAGALAASAGGSDGSALALLTDAGAQAPGDKAGDAAARALAAQAALTGMEAGAKDDAPASARALDLLANTQRPGAADATASGSSVSTHVRDPRWADDFGTRIALLVNQRESVAAISLTPVDLGPVDVNITVRDSQATIHFGAAQAETRALIEASLPKLRELLAAQGFQLMDASVSQGFTRQTKPDAASIPRPASVDDVAPIETRTVTLNGLLDTYA